MVACGFVPFPIQRKLLLLLGGYIIVCVNADNPRKCSIMRGGGDLTGVESEYQFEHVKVSYRRYMHFFREQNSTVDTI